MSETAQAARFGAREWGLARAWIETRWYPLGVAAITAAAAAFLFHQLLAWPPHEDEALPLFIGRHPLDGMFQVVLEERGGAPLHFLVAWVVARLGVGLEGLRAASAVFAVGSLPLIALLLTRLAGRGRALLGTLLVATSWTFLFHGVYGRMYSLFLFTAVLSYLALLRAVERGGRGPWALWALAILATVATHPYGALVLASQGVYVALERRDRLREAIVAFGAVAVVGIPFWLTDLVLAGRFDAGVAAGSRLDVLEYVWQVAGDFTASFPVLPAVLVAGAAGLAVLPRAARVLAASAALVPLAALVVARSTGSPETRHLIFVLPFLALAVATGVARLGRLWGAAAAAALVVAQLAWTWERTPELFEWEPDARQEARADADLALKNLLALERPLGHGIWVLDASKTTNVERSLEIPLASPRPASVFDVREFGPFLVIRTRVPVVTPKQYLVRAGQAMLVGKRLYLGDADINLPTIERAARALRGYGAARSLSTSSR